ncbi:MAG: polysaccharide deacetylase family protein [Clostridiales bacterium]|nr:polysaccharide deacetylase family protein [Clostridiales bacterium]
MKIFYISKDKLYRITAVFLIALISIVYVQSVESPGIMVFLTNKRELPIYSVDTDKKIIAISFDAAWGSERTDELLAILRERDIKATFFLVGIWIDKYPDKVRQIASEGHEIGNHSTSHPHMSKLSSEEIKKELEITQQKLIDLAGDRAVKLFRPPFGDYNDTLILTCRELGYYPIQWDVDSLDWKDLGAENIKRQVLSKAREGSIILFHNDAKYTPAALPEILDTLLNDGYEIVPISKLIYKSGYEIDHTGRQMKVIN